LGPGLGVVELTIALYQTLDLDRDKVLWDVGHQAYPHKLLTGRYNDFHTLRQKNGVAGYLKRCESKFDHFGAGHASTSISAGLGMALARDAKGEDFKVVSIIGDGALTGGMALEAINHAGHLPNTNIMVILNDNEMSISPNVGAISRYLNKVRLSEPVQFIADNLEEQFKNLPFFGDSLTPEMERVKEGMKRLAVPKVGAVIEELGFKYFGPIDGHNIPELIATFKQAHKVHGPKFQAKLPKQYIDVGIAEQHAVTLAGGLACEGMRPVVTIYSTFLQRAFDQIIHDICIQNLPVFFCMDRAGIVGADGPTHQGMYDIAYLRCIPNMTIMAPKDEAELQRMVVTGINHTSGPIAMRYPRGNGLGVPLMEEGWEALPIGKGEILRSGDDILLLGYGTMVNTSLQVAEILSEHGIEATVVNARFVKPLDTELIFPLAQRLGKVVTLEEGCLMGGFGSAVLEALQDANILVPVKRFGVPDKLVDHAKPEESFADLGLTSPQIAQQVLAAFFSQKQTANVG